MSTNLIVVLSILGLAAFIGVFYISHSIEKQRRQKALLIANLNDYAFRFQRLLDYIPQGYLPQDLRLLLMNQLKTRMERLVKLTHGNEKYSKRLDSVNIQINELHTEAKTALPQFKTKDEASELQLLLQELSRTIENLVRNKTISVEEGNRYISSVQSNYIEANINYLLQSAHSAQQDEKFRLAVLNYEKAQVEMQKRNANGFYSEKISEVAALIKELNNQSASQPIAETDNQESELNKAVENLLEEDDSWKKKYF